MFSLTHWARATHICVNNLSIFASDNGLSPGRRQAIIWTNAAILLIGPMAINFSEILIVIQIFSFKKMYLKLSSAKWRLLRLGLNVLMITERHIEKSVELPMIWDAFSLKWHHYVGAGKGVIVCVYHVRTHSQAQVWYGILLYYTTFTKPHHINAFSWSCEAIGTKKFRNIWLSWLWRFILGFFIYHLEMFGSKFPGVFALKTLLISI